MSRAYDVLKKSGVARLPLFERTSVPSQKDPAVVIEFPELEIESSPDLEREFERLYKRSARVTNEVAKTEAKLVKDSFVALAHSIVKVFLKSRLLMALSIPLRN